MAVCLYMWPTYLPARPGYIATSYMAFPGMPVCQVRANA